MLINMINAESPYLRGSRGQFLLKKSPNCTEKLYAFCADAVMTVYKILYTLKIVKVSFVQLGFFGVCALIFKYTVQG